MEDGAAHIKAGLRSRFVFAAFADRMNDGARASRISHTSVMATGLGLGGDVEQALGSVGVPSYVLDTTGVVRWINPAAERLLGDVRGRHFTSVVAPEDSRRARELFARKVLGTAPATDATGVLVSTARHARGRGDQRGAAHER